MAKNEPQRKPSGTPLQDILDRFPSPTTIEALKADAGAGYRIYSVNAYDSEIEAAREQLQNLLDVVSLYHRK